MSPEGKEDSMERRKRELYSRTKKMNGLGDIRTPLSPSTAEAPVSWDNKDEEGEEASKKEDEKPKLPPLAQFEMKRKMPFAAKFLIGSILFFILAVAAAVYIFFGGGNLISPQNIDLQILMPSLVDSGKEADFQILIN